MWSLWSWQAPLAKETRERQKSAQQAISESHKHSLRNEAKCKAFAKPCMRIKDYFHIRLRTYPRFEKEARGNSEMAYYFVTASCFFVCYKRAESRKVHSPTLVWLSPYRRVRKDTAKPDQCSFVVPYIKLLAYLRFYWGYTFPQRRSTTVPRETNHNFQ